MDFKIGDTVFHWSYGLGQVVGLEERAVTGESQLYYVVKIQDLSVWVPADNKAASRLRWPTSARAFKKLFAILAGPATTLADDRRERKLQLHTRMAGGEAKDICQVIRDLTTMEQAKPLNDDDKSVLRRARAMLLREWEYALEVTPAQVEADLYQLLKQPVAVAVA